MSQPKHRVFKLIEDGWVLYKNWDSDEYERERWLVDCICENNVEITERNRFLMLPEMSHAPKVFWAEGTFICTRCQSAAPQHVVNVATLFKAKRL